MARYWVFLSIAYLFGLGAYFYYSVLHALFSSMTASAGMIGPRYLMGAIGLYYISGFVLGIVFLGFDVRARDIRDGIVEVLDARPVTNLELVSGRFIALFLSAWIPIVILVVLIQGFGWLLPLLGSPIGRTVEPLSLVNFVFYMAVPALTFAIGLVFLITLLVRHRLLAALIMVAAIVGLYWALFTVPSPNSAFFDYLGAAQQEFPSDIVPTISLPGGYIHRLGFVLLGLGLVGLAAMIHPRLDGHDRLRPGLASGTLVAAGVAAVSIVVMQRAAEVETLEQWRTAHEARAGEPVADILSIAGTLSIDPGRAIDAELELELAAPADETLQNILLTLNPGFEVEEIAASGNRTIQATHQDGLLDLELDRPLGPGERLSLNLRYSGAPHTGFGYLDSVIVPETMNMNEAQVVLLGYQRGLFDNRYVALTPGLRWLPAAGADVGRDDPRSRRRDYFSVALDVELPPNWLAAATGRREDIGSTGERATFRFAPSTAVPEFALLASEFERFATEVDGITFEVLVYPEHDSNFEVLADARGEIEDWIAERLEAAADAGLEYPFKAFSVVEVPNTLRSFEGGWRLDSALTPPGMMLLRETSFPTARFDFDIVTRNEDQDGGRARIDRNRLVSFFANDFSGGNIFAGASRSFFAHRTSAYGPDAIAVDFVLEELSTMLISGRRSYFSAHLFTNINQAVNSIVSSLQGGSFDSIVGAILSARTNQTDVWNTVLQVPLAEVDPWDDPQRTIDMLSLKGGNLAVAMRDTLGSDAAIELLALLLERHAGSTFSLDELIEAGNMLSDELGPLLSDWIRETGLPGFVARGVEQYRLPDDESGNPQYQLLVRLSNDEPVVGFARINWVVQGQDGPGGSVSISVGSGGLAATATTRRAMTSDPIRIAGRSAIEFGAVLSEPVSRVTIAPYVSHNRDTFLAGELDPSDIPDQTAEPFDGVREIPFEFDEGDRIIADDLDEAFSVITETGDNGLRLSGRGTVSDNLDQGLPVAVGLTPTEWSRRPLAAAFGRYRHTLATVRAGDGLTRAVMPVTIPSPGRWKLEVFSPPYPTTYLGSWNLEVVSANGRDPISFDASVLNPGWNEVGEFELPAGQVSVEFSDRTDGRVIFADAIGWSPVGTQVRTEETNSP